MIDSGNNKYQITLPLNYTSTNYVVLAQPYVWTGSAYIVGEIHPNTENTIICRYDASSNRNTNLPWRYLTIGY